MRILLLADHDGRMLTGSTRNALTAAHAWPKAVIEALVCGYQVEHVAEQAARESAVA